MAFVRADDVVEYWDLEAGRPLGEATVPDLRWFEVFDDGFVTLAAGDATLRRCVGAGVGGCSSDRLVEAEATALALDGDELLVAAADEVRRFRRDGRPCGVGPGGLGVTALLVVGDRLVTGFGDGSVEVRSSDAGSPEAPVLLESTPGQRVVSLAVVSSEVVAAGMGEGTVGLWDLASGRLIDRFELHGPVVHLVVHGERLLAATSVGDFHATDLRAFRLDWCGLVREVWEGVPEVWNAGRVEVRPPPAGHPCLAL
jgi:hypothetical protein